MKVQFDKTALYQIIVFASDDSWHIFPNGLFLIALVSEKSF